MRTDWKEGEEEGENRQERGRMGERERDKTGKGDRKEERKGETEK